MGCLSGIFIVVTIFSKLFPMMAVWEVEEGVEIEHDRKAAIEIREKREAEKKMRTEASVN